MPLNLEVELEREDDGRWIAEVVDLPGVMVYSATPAAAFAAAKALALRVLADRMDAGEDLDGVVFERREPVAV